MLDGKINTAWQGNKGDYITFALKNGTKVDKVSIVFTRDNNLPANFEIQLSGGGGQFLTVYSGTVSDYDKLISYPFKEITASDLRIVLNDERIGVAELVITNYYFFMKTLLYCMLGLSLTACAPQKTASNQDELAMLVGTYTNGTSKGIYTFRFNQETGASTPLSSIELPNPSYLTPSEDGKFVYAVSEMNDTTAALNALAFDKEKGTLRLLNTQLSQGADPCYVATNGNEVLTANYSGGSMSVFPINKNGTLQPVDTLFEGTASGPDTVRQIAPHVHCTVFSPDGKYIFATDFSADRILRFVLHPKDIIPHPSLESVNIEADSGPRHLTFSPDGKRAYVISELSGKVTAFNYNDGKLEQIQTITADTLAARGSADIHLSPDGKYLYASNRLKGDGIAIFAVNPENGTLAKVAYQLTGIHPRHFNITPNGKYLLAACRDSNVIQVYQRDPITGLLTDIHQDILLDKPVCVQFVE